MRYVKFHTRPLKRIKIYREVETLQRHRSGPLQFSQKLDGVRQLEPFQSLKQEFKAPLGSMNIGIHVDLESQFTIQTGNPCVPHGKAATLLLRRAKQLPEF